MKNNIKDIKNKIQQAFGKYTFIEDGHYYLCDGKRVGISTTGLISQYENHFDSETISQQVANKRGISQQEVLEEWRIENLHSTIKGSFIHEFAQSLWEGKEYKFDYSKVPEEIDIDRLKSDINLLIPQAINFYNDYKDMYELIGCEIYLGDEDFDECGATDQILYNKYTGGIAIIDYKTNKEIKRESYKHQKMLIPLQQYDDCNYIHYSIQLSGYKYKFEKNTKLKVDETFIVYFNINADNYEIIEPLNMQKEVERILRDRKERIMGKCMPILIIGKSGSGKSTSLRNLKKEEYSLVNVLNKDLPFKNGRDIKGLSTKNYELVKAFIEKTPKDIVVIDDFGYIMTDKFVKKATETGYTKFSVIAQEFYNFVEFIKTLDGDKRVYLMMHEEKSENGDIAPKTCGKMLDNQICVEGLFSILLRCVFDGKEHKFKTATDGLDVCKSPIDMFESEFIDNDLKLVDDTICEYYGIEKKNIESEEN